jgi:hypothetical protein
MSVVEAVCGNRFHALEIVVHGGATYVPGAERESARTLPRLMCDVVNGRAVGFELWSRTWW